MKQTLLLFISFLLIAAGGYAQQRSEKNALLEARKFLEKQKESGKKTAAGSKELSVAYTCVDTRKTQSSSQDVYYYVFNVGKDNGFIIISGDERAKTVLGYTDTGDFDIEQLSDNFRYWLSFYQKELDALFKQPISSLSNKDTKKEMQSDPDGFAKEILPLVTAEWGQDAPYNDKCPQMLNDEGEYQNTITGCVATAMAQAMYYYKWPEKGNGYLSYKLSSFKDSLRANFSATTYDWTNMKDEYGNTSSDIEKDAVSTLMYHCGVGVKMDYGLNASAAYLENIPKAMATYFRYDTCMHNYNRRYFYPQEWEKIIKEELNSRRIVLYYGADVYTAHLFICDGYDQSGFFHINWGWADRSNGYFQLSALDPATLDPNNAIIAGFYSNQSIIAGIQKMGEPYLLLKDKMIFNDYFQFPSGNTVGRNESITIQYRVYNYGADEFVGNLNWGLYDENNNFIALLMDPVFTFRQQASKGSGFHTLVVIPESVANGKYRLYPVAKHEKDTEWRRLRRPVNNAQYIDVSVESNSIEMYADPKPFQPKLVLNSITPESPLSGGYVKNKFNVSITNEGEGEYHSFIQVYLEKAGDGDVQSSLPLSQYPIFLSAGETKDFVFNADPIFITKSADYYLVTKYDKNNSTNSISYIPLDSTKVYVINPVLNKADVALTAQISFPDNSSVNKDNPVLTAVVKNTGTDDILNRFQVEIVPENYGAYIAVSPVKNTLILSGQEIKLEFNEALLYNSTNKTGLEPGKKIQSCF
ncbi:MAG: C10 family peptidase [Dysgonomonas sp.]